MMAGLLWIRNVMEAYLHYWTFFQKTALRASRTWQLGVPLHTSKISTYTNGVPRGVLGGSGELLL